MKKELRRDPNNKIIAGVCSGIANYLDIDPVIIRLIWAAAIFLFGTGFLFYIICWIIIPEESKWQAIIKYKNKTDLYYFAFRSVLFFIFSSGKSDS